MEEDGSAARGIDEYDDSISHAGERLVERVHRTTKASLKAKLEVHANWLDALPVVLLSMRAAVKSDINCSAAETMYGEQLRLPGDRSRLCSELAAEDTPDEASSSSLAWRGVATHFCASRIINCNTRTGAT